jgi:hypothetical protein
LASADFSWGEFAWEDAAAEGAAFEGFVWDGFAFEDLASDVCDSPPACAFGVLAFGELAFDVLALDSATDFGFGAGAAATSDHIANEVNSTIDVRPLAPSSFRIERRSVEDGGARRGRTGGTIGSSIGESLLRL